jgi:hypothetical protein
VGDRFDSLRENPRYYELMEKMNFPVPKAE